MPLGEGRPAEAQASAPDQARAAKSMGTSGKIVTASSGGFQEELGRNRPRVQPSTLWL